MRHEALAGKWGEERVLSGDYPGNARKKRAVMKAEHEPQTGLALVEVNASDDDGDPAGIRPSLARLAAANLSELQRALLDAALSASTTRWTTVTCSGCQTRSRVELPVPDVKARLQAIQLLLSESLGKAPTAPEVATPTLPQTVRRVEMMGWTEMTALAATLFIDEIAVTERDGGETLVRERVAALSEGQRRVLREALAAAPV
jgi:hypothetical protein